MEVAKIGGEVAGGRISQLQQVLAYLDNQTLGYM